VVPEGRIATGDGVRVARAAARCSVAALLVGLTLAVALAGATGASASYPGANGLLVFDGVDPASQTVQLYSVGADGSGLTLLTQPAGTEWNECPSWSADAALIFFDSYLNPGPSRIYRIDADGADRQLADRDTGPSHTCPSLGPGNAQIAAVQLGSPSNSIVRMNVDGTGRVVLARATKLQMNFAPHYSPDGRRIVFDRVTFKEPAGIAKSALLVSRGRGKKLVDITPRGKNLFFGPSWAPDGQSLVAVRGDSTIVRMNPQGGDVRVLYSVSGAQLESPVVSPDGTRIAFVQCVGDCGDPGASGNGSVWVMNADGTGATAIVTQDAEGVQPAGVIDWGTAGPQLAARTR
jgi:Tol biopolymer transport system component